MSDPLLVVRDLRVAHQGRAVLALDELALHRHETLALVGPNGSGKSTLLRVAGLLTRPTRGQVWFDGERVTYQSGQLLALRRRMAEVLQEPLLFRMSVQANVALGLRFRGLPAREVEQRVGTWLERLRILPLRRRPARELSGGEARRASLARALVLEPELLLLDEPFAALDTPTRDDLLSELREILATTRTTTVLATHERGEALALGDRVAMLSGGRLVQVGSPEEVFARPRTEEVARFVGVETLILGRTAGVEEGLVRVDVGPAVLEVQGSSHPGEAVLVCVRPEDVMLVAGDDPTPRSARNNLAGRIVRVVPWDSHLRVTVDCGVLVVAAVTKASFRDLALAVGGRVRVTFKATAAHLIARPGSR